ncbi:MAG TPA: amino acid adenylation domain-containing protein, partial [Longimicrobium sp.]|nr:amino acid adenylation domain-containing protein [Longimicrobium sp.]
MDQTATAPRVRMFDRKKLEARDHWLRALGREIALAGPLPDADAAFSADAADAAGEVAFVVGDEAREALDRLSRGSPFLSFVALAAALHVALYRYAALDAPAAVAVGTPPRLGEDGSAPAPNLLPVVAEVDAAAPFRDLLAEVRRALLDAQARQDYPFAQMLRDQGDDARPDALRAVTLGVDGLHGVLPADQAAEVGLAIRMRQGGGRLTGTVRFRADRFRADTAVRFARHYTTLLGALLADTAAPVGAAALMDAGERDAVLAAARVPAVGYPEAPVHALFAEQAAATPGAVAIEFGGERMTYAGLDIASNRLAHQLRRRGVRIESRVGISLPRGFDLYVAMLGILKAGAAFVPLDPAYPAERRAWMAADAGVSIVVGREDADGVAETIVRLDADREAIGAEPETAPEVEVHPDGAAYVMYTSGSTGTPKGVAVPHRAVVRLVRETDFATFGPGETILQLAPVSFDASTFEIWGALLNGGTLAVFPPETPSLEALARFLPERGVTTLWLTAGLFHPMADAHPGAFRGVRQLIAGGDVLSPAHVRRVLEACPGLVVVNGYGPTENTTFTACARIAAPGEVEGTVPIGTPIAHTSIFILDPAMRPVPVGVPGELYAGGAGLARGYVGRPGMTAERFVPNPFGGAGERLYRTGDRVRGRGDGRIEFLGRADAQVKIRGFRVEPGEVEAALLAHPGVREAVVAVHEDAPGDRRLVAYAVADDVVDDAGGAPDAAALKAYLAARLPDHLVPSSVVLLPAFPLTPNGKVDRAALPAPGAEAAEQVAPRTPTEEIVAGIWADLLHLPAVGVEDDFFVLGGHSLLATQVAARVREAFGVEVALRALFDAPTVAALAASVDAALAGG